MQKFLTLENDSACKVKFKLGVTQTIDLDDGTKEEIQIEQKPHGKLLSGSKTCLFVTGFELSCSVGEIEAHSKQDIFITLRPSQPAILQSCLYYQLLLVHSTTEWQSLCHVKFEGIYPSLAVMDVHTDGNINSLSKSQVWKMLQIDRSV